jgi:mevalonate kinase
VIQVRESFSAKVMLFGEYSILLGSPALSIPFNYYRASLVMPPSGDSKFPAIGHESNRMLRQYYEGYLSGPGMLSGILDLERFHADLISGLYLDSTIPLKYGVGSSGALCAAIYSRYAFRPLGLKDKANLREIAELRGIFSAMESWFHGKSSGLDPLVIYLHHPVIISEGGTASPASIPADIMEDNGKLFLVDTGQSRSTASLVPLFLEHFGLKREKAVAGKKLCEINRLCITHLCAHEMGGFIKNLVLLSDFQFHNLSAMIPEHIRPSWSEGLESELFSLKLCGSGGGGFLVGFTGDYEKTLNYFRKKSIPVIPVDIDQDNQV